MAPTAYSSEINPQAQHIAHRIMANIDGHKASDEAFVVSVYGEWGVGKTHCLRGIESWFNEHIDGAVLKDGQSGVSDNTQTNTNPKAEDDIKRITLPVMFSSWQYEKEPHLIIPLLETIKLALERLSTPEGESALTDFKTTLTNFTTELAAKMDWHSLILKLLGTASAMDLFPGVSWLRNFFEHLSAKPTSGNEAAKNPENAEESSAPSSDSTAPQGQESIYYNFQQQLEKLMNKQLTYGEGNYQLRLIVLVDDLDRCLPEKSVEMLESIKLFLNVKGFSFVLAVDDDIVERGIKHRYADYINQSTQTEGEAEKLPISGHEYLEKIVHLPVHLNRWPKDAAQTMFLHSADTAGQGHSHPISPKLHTAFNKKIDTGVNASTDQANISALTIVYDCVPLVPRKLIRLLEALEFQFTSLLSGGADDGQDEQKRIGYLQQGWHLKTATRITIIAQLYPDIYRELRQSQPLDKFWQMLFSLCVNDHGQVAYSNLLHIHRPNQDELSSGLMQAESPTNQANTEANSQPRSWTKQQLISAKDPTQVDAVSATIREHFKAMRADQSAWQYDLVDIIKFIQKTETSSASRNGNGLLKLWQGESGGKEGLIAGHRGWTQQRQAIFGEINNSELLRDLYLLPNWTPAVKEHCTAIVSTIKNNDQEQTAANTQTPSPTTPPPKVEIVEQRQRWINSITALAENPQAIADYLGSYPRTSNAKADADSFTELLVEFHKLTAKQRQAWQQAAQSSDKQQPFGHMLGKQQYDYLITLCDAARGWRTPDIDKLENERFEKHNEGSASVIQDHWTGFDWQTADQKKMKYEQALQLNQGEFTLPLARTLQTLIDYSEYRPAISSTAQELNCDPVWYWAQGQDKNGKRWALDFSVGDVHRNHLGADPLVRLVRGSRSVIEH